MSMESILPGNQESEAYILSAIMRSKELREEIFPLLVDADFHFLEHQTIFQEIKKLLSHEISVDLVASSLRKNGNLEKAGGVQYLANLAFIGNSSDFDWHFSQLKTATLDRNLSFIAKDAYERALAGKGGEELVTELLRKLSDLSKGGATRIKTTAEIVQDYKGGKSLLDVIDEKMQRVASGGIAFDGILSGYPRLDAIIGGFEKGMVTIIGARTSMGKTTFLLNLIFNICEHNPDIQIGFFSLEMTKEILTMKMVCTLAGVNFKNLRKGLTTTQEREKISKFLETFGEKYRVVFADESGLKISNLKSITRRLVLRYGIQILFVDYLTLVQADTSLSNKHLEVDQVSKGLQALAKELKIPIVCLAQLNRGVTSRPDKRPMTSDLRESGSTEEDADLVLLLHRPKVFSKDDPAKEDLTEVYVGKNRIEGDLGKLDYRFENGRLIELDKVEDIKPNDIFESLCKATTNRGKEEPRKPQWYDEK